MQEQWMTVDETAAILQVHPQTIRRWLRSGQLIGTMLNRRAGYRIRRSVIEQVLEEGVPEEGKTLVAA